MQRPHGGTFQLLPGRTSRARRRRRAGSHRISFGLRGRPSSAGRQSQVKKGHRALPLARQGTREGRGSGPRCPRVPPHGRERCPQADIPLRAALPQPGKVSCKAHRASPLSQRHQQHQQQQPRLPAERSGAAGPPPRSPAQEPRRDPAAPAAFPLPNPHSSLPAGGTLSTANVIFVMNNFRAEGEKK